MIRNSACPRFPIRLGAVLLLGALGLGGCANLGDGALSGAFVDPARYDQFDCQQLEVERGALAKRTAELQKLIDKAATGTAGTLVGTVAYRNDYISARAQAKLLEENWVRSKCIATMPLTPPRAPATPAAPVARHRS